ncbi:MAG: glycosyltransferase family 2 protein [Elusimicrobia bacterium]|nr:glycosyltransferase family 2 protein [Elusimicrobiota bacterium]
MSKKHSLTISVVIPAYNEEEGIGEVILNTQRALQKEGLPKEDTEILVVDDGSRDRTANLAEEAGATVVRHPTNMGYGKSLLTGFGQARHEWILMIDGDGSYPPEEIGKLLLKARDFDMVIGARQGTHFWGTPFQAFLRWIYLKIAKFVVGERIPDANSGLRLIRRAALEGAFPVQCLGYSFSTTMTLSFLKLGRFVSFVPIEYHARRGVSKVRRLRDIPRTLQLMTQVILYFNPLKLVVTIAFLPLGLAVVFGIFTWMHGTAYLGMALASFYFSMLVFLLGCVLESLRYR